MAQSPPEPTQIDAYYRSSFAAPIGGKARAFDIYTRGEGPPIILIQEMPGLGQESLRLADELVNAGFEVTVPHFFGPLGRVSFVRNPIRVLCMRREFHMFATGRTSPVVGWLAALARELKRKTGYPGVGTIGMCLTGNFAISLMADDAVLAGVASQPSLPLFNSKDLHMSADDIAAVRTKLDDVGPMRALHFEKDPLCTPEKFKLLDDTFNDDKERIKLTTIPGPGHSVLTMHFVDEDGHPTRQALDDVLDYFSQRLKPAV